MNWKIVTAWLVGKQKGVRQTLSAFTVTLCFSNQWLQIEIRVIGIGAVEVLAAVAADLHGKTAGLAALTMVDILCIERAAAVVGTAVEALQSTPEDMHLGPNERLVVATRFGAEEQVRLNLTP